MPNTPKTVCEKAGGTWNESIKSKLPQCQLGCCLIGDQAAFTTQITCSKMSGLYGLNVNFLANVNNELDCLANANPSLKGACVYTQNYVKTCTLTTKSDCQTMAKNSAYSDVQFNNGLLCTAGTLGTNCVKTGNTQCDDSGNVRFVDSCSNLANIYDYNKLTDSDYWTYIQEPTCGDKAGNKNSASCGACDYLSGSMCKQKAIGDSVSSGNYICKDLDCKTYRGSYSGSLTGVATADNYPRHGETWCATDNKGGGTTTSPGATYFRMMCYNGEVTNYECEKTRQEICAETVVDAKTNFKTANCRANVWQDCTTQNNSADCNDATVRDCTWINNNGFYFTTDSSGARYLSNDPGTSNEAGMCVPKYPPGFNRDGGDATANCILASAVCYVKFEKGVSTGGNWKCTQNCSCLDSSWQTGLNNVCNQLGDCGNKINYIGKSGKTQVQIKMVNISTTK